MISRVRSAVPSLITWLLAAAFFGPFLIYPVLRVLRGALMVNGQFSLPLLLMPIQDWSAREGLRNAFVLAIAVTLISSLFALAPAYASARLRFAGKPLLTGLLLVPLLLPPFVGAVGLRQLLAREGLFNTLLMARGMAPIDFLQMASIMVAIVAALHLYPLIYLNVSAAWANIDPALEEAAENMGASHARTLRTVTLPLLLPGYLSGALIVFVLALTDLGTPLVFNFTRITSVQIYNARTVVNAPLPYVLALWLLVIAGIVFFASRRFLQNSHIATLSRGTRRAREQAPRPWQLPFLYGGFIVLITLALLPHIGVILCSLARDWTSTLLPDWTVENYRHVFARPDTLGSMKISILCALGSMTLDVILGAALAWAIVRGRVWASSLLDALAMLPLALPGLILAFGLLAAFLDTPLTPRYNPVPLLIIAYAVRRLPYALRAVSAGLQQTSITLEEASLNLGASPLRTLWNVTRPLVAANLLAAGLLTFAFAVLEVSDSLILSLSTQNVPLSKAIFQLSAELSGGTYLACALGVLGMGLLTVTFLVANRLLGKQLGALFRV